MMAITMPSRPRLLAISVALAIVAAPAISSAQDAPNDRATFQDATWAMWGLATLEVSLLTGSGIVAASEVCDDDEDCGIAAIALAGTLLALTITAGIAAGSADTPADVPFVVHNAMTAGGAMFLLGGSIYDNLGGGGDESLGSAFVLGVSGIMGMASYATWRRDQLLRDPGAAVGAHLMTWLQPASSALAMLIAAALEADDDLLPVLAGIVGVATFGIGIGVAEAGI